MKIKIMYPNQMGRLEFTKEQLEELLKEAYDEGWHDGKNNGSYTINSGKVSTLDSTDYWYRYPQVTCTADLAIASSNSNTEIFGTASHTCDGSLANVATTLTSHCDAATIADKISTGVDINDIS